MITTSVILIDNLFDFYEVLREDNVSNKEIPIIKEHFIIKLQFAFLIISYILHLLHLLTAEYHIDKRCEKENIAIIE